MGKENGENRGYVEISVREYLDGRIDIDHPANTSPEAIAVYAAILASAIRSFMIQGIIGEKQDDQVLEAEQRGTGALSG